MFRFFRCLSLLVMMLVSLASARAQVLPDEASIEAMIGNHKVVSAVLDVRCISEIALAKAHKNTAKAVADYKAVNDSLDKYQRSFDILNTILSGAATAYKTMNTVNRSKANIQGMLKLLDYYRTDFLMKLNVEVTDTAIISICNSCVRDTRDAVNGLWKSYAQLASYFTGVTECKTSNLMATFDGVNESLDELDKVLSRSYNRLWYYMLIRSHYYKAELFTAIDVHEIVTDAFGTWMQSALEVGEDIRTRNHTERGRHKGGGGLLGEYRRKGN